MYTIYDCVSSFIPLLDTKYHLVLGRKGVAVELSIRFGEKDCFHLMGLQYLMKNQIQKKTGCSLQIVKRVMAKLQLDCYADIMWINLMKIMKFEKLMYVLKNVGGLQWRSYL